MRGEGHAAGRGMQNMLKLKGRMTKALEGADKFLEKTVSQYQKQDDKMFQKGHKKYLKMLKWLKKFFGKRDKWVKKWEQKKLANVQKMDKKIAKWMNKMGGKKIDKQRKAALEMIEDISNLAIQTREYVKTRAGQASRLMENRYSGVKVKIARAETVLNTWEQDVEYSYKQYRQTGQGNTVDDRARQDKPLCTLLMH